MKVATCEAVFENTGGISLMARVKLADGSYAQQSDIESITLKIFRKRDGDEVSADGGVDVDVSETIFNALRSTDPVSSAVLWTKDSTGFNFLYRTLGSQLAGGGEEFRFEFKLIPTGGGADDALWLPFDIPTLSLYSV